MMIQNNENFNFPIMEYNSSTDIISASKSKEVALILNENVKKYYSIDIAQAMNRLSNVGTCLQLAYAGSKGFSFSLGVVKILCSYQTMIKNSQIVCRIFLNNSLSALKYHVVALKLTKENGFNQACNFLSKCEHLAQKMEIASAQLTEAANKLCNESKEVLFEATINETTSLKEKERIKEQIKTSKYKEEALRKNVQSLDIKIEKKIEKEDEFRNKAFQFEEKASTHGMWKRLVKVFTLTMVDLGEKQNFLNRQAKDMKEREIEAAEIRKQLQKQQLKQNSELAEVVQVLKSSAVKKDYLNTAVHSLEVSIKALGGIKTIFENTRVFWHEMSEHCKELRQQSEYIKDYESIQEMMINEITSSGFNWLTLGKVNNQAVESIQSVSNKVDGIMSDLPTKEESLCLVERVANLMLEQIQQNSMEINAILIE